jgi:hypothetical protein
LRLSNVGTTVNNINGAITTFRSVKEWYQAHIDRKNANRYQIVIKENEFLYTPLLRWIVRNSKNEPKEVQVISRHDSSLNMRIVDYYFHGEVSQYMSINGHSVEIVADDGRSSNDGGATPGGGDVRASMIPTPCLRIYTQNDAGRKAVMQFLEELATQNKSNLQVYRMSYWGDWFGSPLRPRPFDSVILKSDTKEILLEDLDRFMESETLYTEWGISWHRGYLLYGVPGTGKTSLIKALASKLGLDVYFINVASLKSDSDFETAIAKVRDRSILVLEDIDGAKATIDRDSEDYDPESGGVSLTGLLNTLDGLITPHGLITIMTTNHRDKLDPALIRPGRADLHIELDYLDDEQFHKMCRRWFGQELSLSVENLQITPGDIVEIFKTNIDDLPRAEVLVKEFVTNKEYNGRAE